MEVADDLSGKETDERDQMGSKDLATGDSASFPLVLVDTPVSDGLDAVGSGEGVGVVQSGSTS